MKYKGKKPGINSELLVLPRPDGEIVFIASAVPDLDKFNNIISPPELPTILRNDGSSGKDYNDKDFIKKLDDWSKKKTLYLILKSLENSPDLEWEKTKLNDPNTWESWEEELKESGLSDIEIRKLTETVMIANSLSDSMLKEARDNFLTRQQNPVL